MCTMSLSYSRPSAPYSAPQGGVPRLGGLASAHARQDLVRVGPADGEVHRYEDAFPVAPAVLPLQRWAVFLFKVSEEVCAHEQVTLGLAIVSVFRIASLANDPPLVAHRVCARAILLEDLIRLFPRGHILAGLGVSFRTFRR